MEDEYGYISLNEPSDIELDLTRQGFWKAASTAAGDSSSGAKVSTGGLRISLFAAILT